MYRNNHPLIQFVARNASRYMAQIETDNVYTVGGRHNNILLFAYRPEILTANISHTITAHRLF